MVFKLPIVPVSDATPSASANTLFNEPAADIEVTPLSAAVVVVTVITPRVPRLSFIELPVKTFVDEDITPNEPTVSEIVEIPVSDTILFSDNTPILPETETGVKVFDITGTFVPERVEDIFPINASILDGAVEETAEIEDIPDTLLTVDWLNVDVMLVDIDACVKATFDDEVATTEPTVSEVVDTPISAAVCPLIIPNEPTVSEVVDTPTNALVDEDDTENVPIEFVEMFPDNPTILEFPKLFTDDIELTPEELKLAESVEATRPAIPVDETTPSNSIFVSLNVVTDVLEVTPVSAATALIIIPKLPTDSTVDTPVRAILSERITPNVPRLFADETDVTPTVAPEDDDAAKVPIDSILDTAVNGRV